MVRITRDFKKRHMDILFVFKNIFTLLLHLKRPYWETEGSLIFSRFLLIHNFRVSWNSRIGCNVLRGFQEIFEIHLVLSCFHTFWDSCDKVTKCYICRYNFMHWLVCFIIGKILGTLLNGMSDRNTTVKKAYAKAMGHMLRVWCFSILLILVINRFLTFNLEFESWVCMSSTPHVWEIH